MAKTLYAVSRGSYSDYSVVAIFSTRERAEQHMATFPDSDYNKLEEYPLNPPFVDRWQKGYRVWHVVMLRDGTTEKCNLDNGHYWLSDCPSYYLWRRTKAPAYAGRGIPDALNAKVLAKSQSHAIKIANEKRAQMIANGEWD
jgi:hypothetical protein